MDANGMRQHLLAYGFGRVQSFNDMLTQARKFGFSDIDALSRFLYDYTVQKRREYNNDEKRLLERNKSKEELIREKRLARNTLTRKKDEAKRLLAKEPCLECNNDDHFLIMTIKDGVRYMTCATIGPTGSPVVGCGYSTLVDK